MRNEDSKDDGVFAETDELSIQSLLWEAQLGFIAHNYTSAISFLEQALVLGSPSAAASLANVYVRGMKHDGQVVIHPDLGMAIDYFQHGLELIKTGNVHMDTLTGDQDDDDSYNRGGEDPPSSPAKSSKIYFRPMDNHTEEEQDDNDDNGNIGVLHDIVIGISQLFIYDKVKKSQSTLWDTCADILRSHTSYAQPEAGKYAASIRIHASFALGMAEMHMLKRKEADETQCNVRARANFTLCTETGFCGVREADMLITKAQSRLKKLSTMAVKVPSMDPVRGADNVNASPDDDTSPPQSVDSATGSTAGSGSGSSHLAAIVNPSEVQVVGVPQSTTGTTSCNKDAAKVGVIGLDGCHFCHKQGRDLPLCSCRKVRYCSFGCKLKDVETGGHACSITRKVCSD